ncbi:DUF5412 family protein [Ornithinibacillus halotolerans]|uniref:Uncharacterized protein n=1 Tax=Ornithinibacillus halotolerans TaxID=1274357 RepID=A0A916RLK3_9BACI|nr:DUF5412 family protein [Ornithinibacillus halotolerans]GGA61866.1 hypothetical protein GCM10008025_02260 [Ornithinibacillus halotolerans]
MAMKYNHCSFYIILLCIGLAAYSVYSQINHTWIATPPTYILLILSIMAFIYAIKGRKDKTSWVSTFRSWLTITLSVLLSIVLLLVIFLQLLGSLLGGNEHLKTIHSPDETYTIDFYQWDAGAAGTFGIRGELNGPLWFKKSIYLERRVEDVSIEWISNTVVSINNHKLDLAQGETFGYE